MSFSITSISSWEPGIALRSVKICLAYYTGLPMTLLVFRPFGSLIQSRRQLAFRLFLGHCFQFGDQGCMLVSVGRSGEVCCSMAAACSFTVAILKSDSSGRTRSRAFCSRVMICIAFKEFPPKSRKRSSTPIPGTPSTSSQVRTMVFSRNVLGATNWTSDCRTWASGGGSARRSTLPFVVTGI